ncbi:hypothetical protein PMAYCL1PPCAC_14693, partial [Pristionchus mayeri]
LIQPDDLRSSKFTRLGINGRIAYFQCARNDGLGVWRVDTLVPSSHKRILFIPYSEMNYVHSTMGRDQSGRALIYILLITSADETFSFRIHELRIANLYQDPIHTAFDLHLSDVRAMMNVPLHDAALGVGRRTTGPSTTVFLYDGSIIQGDIPYWRVLLDREGNTFNIEEDMVPALDPVRVGGRVADDEPRMVSRFPVVIDGAKRRFLRFGLDQRMFVFTEYREDGEPTSEGKWLPYSERLDSEHSILEICGSRQLRETYSSSGHRATAIESRYTFIVDEDVCILRHRADDRHHHYYRLVLDDANLEYHFVSCGVAEIGAELSVGRTSYTMVTERIAVLSGMEELAVVDLQPQRLSEIAFWAIQKQVSSRSCPTGALYAGLSVKELGEMFGYAGSQPLI